MEQVNLIGIAIGATMVLSSPVIAEELPDASIEDIVQIYTLFDTELTNCGRYDIHRFSFTDELLEKNIIAAPLAQSTKLELLTLVYDDIVHPAPVHEAAVRIFGDTTLDILGGFSAPIKVVDWIDKRLEQVDSLRWESFTCDNIVKNEQAVIELFDAWFKQLK